MKMKISEVINELSSILVEQGDLEVVTDNAYFVSDVEVVEGVTEDVAMLRTGEESL